MSRPRLLEAVDAALRGADPLDESQDWPPLTTSDSPVVKNNVLKDNGIGHLGHFGQQKGDDAEQTDAASLNSCFGAVDADNDEHLVQHAVTLINARIGISDVDDTWELALLGKNLTDETWSPNGTDIPLTDGKFFKLTSPPRSFSLQFTVRI